MVKLEEKNKKRRNKENLQKLILESISLAGFLTVGLVAPNVIKSMHKLGLVPKARQREYVASSASKLAKRGLIRFDGKKYCLTSEGEKILRLWQFADFKLRRPKHWDGKWRVVIFDIPEKKRKTRDQIRRLFHQSGLYLLQDSVWVFPFDCEDLLTLLKTDLNVGRNILYLIVDELEGDKYLRKHFSL